MIGLGIWLWWSQIAALGGGGGGPVFPDNNTGASEYLIIF